MANTKKIILDWSETGGTAYAIVRREADGFLLNDADGSFAATPADPYLSLSEHSVIKGRYEASEARASWSDGRHTVAIYKQTGGSPAPASDTIIGSGEMVIKDDSEVYLDALPSFVQKWILNRLVVGDTEVRLYDDDDVTVLKTWTWDGATKVRSKAT